MAFYFTLPFASSCFLRLSLWEDLLLQEQQLAVPSLSEGGLWRLTSSRSGEMGVWS